MSFRHRFGRRVSHFGASRPKRSANREGAKFVAARTLSVEGLESRAMLSAVSFAGSYSQDFNTLPHAGTSFFYGGLTDLDARPIEAVGMAGWQLYWHGAGMSELVVDYGSNALEIGAHAFAQFLFDHFADLIFDGATFIRRHLIDCIFGQTELFKDLLAHPLHRRFLRFLQEDLRRCRRLHFFERGLI